MVGANCRSCGGVDVCAFALALTPSTIPKMSK
jgi:hypothetical protein